MYPLNSPQDHPSIELEHLQQQFAAASGANDSSGAPSQRLCCVLQKEEGDFTVALAKKRHWSIGEAMAAMGLFEKLPSRQRHWNEELW